MSTSMGRYELLGLLGRGGMAEVYLACRRSGSVEKRLVIKRVRRDRAGDARSLELLIREARLSMSLAHQNVVTVFDFGRIDDDVFLAMEHVEGRDLDSTLARPGASPVPPVCAAYVAAQCCLGLDHAHRRLDAGGRPLGIVHRDVTPGNILVSQSGEVKLADFGVAGTADERGGRLRGTAAFMAPEQARGDVVGPTADMYGLGLVLWEMLAGRRARTGTVDDLLAQARDARPPAPLPEAPAALLTVVARATAAEPADRYQTARDMLADLDAYLVAARAAAPGPTLSDGLAAWFAAAWAGAPSPLAPLPAGAGIGLADGMTLRSMAVTADDAGDVSMDASVDAELGGARVEGIDDLAAEASGQIRQESATHTAAPRRSRGGAVAIGGAVIVALVAITWGRPGPRARVETAGPSPEAAPSAQAQASEAGEPVVAPDPPAPEVALAAGVVTPSEGATHPPVHRPGTERLGPDDGLGKPNDSGQKTESAGQAAVAPRAAPPAARRAVTIGAQPWANFTVDDDPVVHQTPETVQLAPGRHRVRFHNPPLGIERDVTLVVPADRDIRHVERLR